MSPLRAKLAQAMVHRLGLSTLIQNRIDKYIALHDREQRKALQRQEKRSEKYLENLKGLASEQNKRLKMLERRLKSNTDKLKQVVKLHRTSSRTVETLDKKVHLLHRARHHDQLSEAVKQFKTTYPLSEVASHINRSISNAVLSTTPCPHTVIDDILPENIYTGICSNIPPLEFWREGRLGRDNWTIEEDTAPLRHEAAWMFMNNVIASTIMSPALVNKFGKYFAPPTPRGDINESGISDIDYKLHDGRLMLRRPGYSIEPHVDPRRSILTVLLYMGTSSGSEDYGTKLFTSDREIPLKYSGIYYPLREGASCVLAKSIPCRTNSMLVFSSRHGIHGAEIPSDTTPSTLTRYTYHFFIGVNKHKDVPSNDPPGVSRQ